MASSRIAREASVEVDGAPAIRGLSFRRVLEKPNFVELARVIQESRDADRMEIVETPRDLADDFKHLQNCNPEEDMLLVSVKNELVGFCRCEWHSRVDGDRTYEHNVYLTPKWRVRGLRRALLRHNERRLVEVAASHPRDCVKTYETRANNARNPWKSLLVSEGYKAYRHNLQMIRPTSQRIPESPTPRGVDLRIFKMKEMRKVFEAGKEAFKEEPNYSEEFWTEDAMKYTLSMRSFMPELWLIAWKGEDVAGAAMNVIDVIENKKYRRKWGYVAVVFVRRPYRHQGLASALVARSIDLLREEGMSHCEIGVDSENPTGARRVYERLGFKVFEDYLRLRKPLDRRSVTVRRGNV